MYTHVYHFNVIIDLYGLINHYLYQFLTYQRPVATHQQPQITLGAKSARNTKRRLYLCVWTPVDVYID